ncbi:helix-turn-helix domain-containing protein [Streptomyces aureoverticillatus]|uniref:helix-turn-helix domain-containing protein n=1 Tax=Streptomyces aureoverticillatus TaxID=66871 RepID=UPI0013DC013E|nr:helix-turn-helix domain-containing protein [Streptomyces aureoverticillatus]QIB43398.1 helix-turn-helix domain-containing protein [Streptomyces aureoverticillatus]
MDTVDLLLHPLRMRIVNVMYDGRTRTTSELCALLPDISKATLYRHIGILADGGLLVVAQEERVRGSVQRHYRLHRARAVIDPDIVAAMPLDDYRRAFAVAMAALLAEFDTYLDRDGADPITDLVGFRQYTLSLTRDELTEMVTELRDVILARTHHEPAPGRTRYLLSPVLFPVSEPGPEPSA